MTQSHKDPETVGHRHRVVVVGGGFGGLSAVTSLKDAPVDVTLVDRHNYHLFQPLLYQVATGSLSPGEIAVPLRAIVRRQRNVRVILGEVEDVDLATHEIVVARAATDDEEIRLPYDTLIVAAGMRNHYFGHDEWRDVAPALKNLEDALDIRARVLLAFEAAETETDPGERQRWLTFVVVGGGPTGVELAGQIAEISRDTMRDQFRAFNPAQARVYLVEGADRVLLAFTEDQSERARRDLEALGVTVRTGCMVSGADADGVELMQGTHHERIEARTIVWAAGVTASPLAALLAELTGTGTDRAGRVQVEPDLSLPGHPEVIVVGDMAAIAGRPLPGVAPVAMQMGRHAADSVRRRAAGGGATAFQYRDKGNLATIGRARAVASLFGMRFHGFVAWWLWLAVHLFYLIGFQNRLLVMTKWTWSFFTHGRGARLITGTDPDSPTRLRTPETGHPYHPGPER